MLNAIRHLARDETGAYGVMVALLIPVFLLLGIFAVDVSSWYVHHRQLQIQADAGALAGAAYYKYPCTDAPISAAAASYAGKDRNAFADVPAAGLTFQLNKSNYFNQTNPADTGLTGSPCDDMAVDVKMTETTVPWFFGDLFSPTINAQARVEIRRLDGKTGMRPIAVPAPDPKRVRVTFVSEVTGEKLGEKELCETTPIGGVSMWDNAATNSSGFDAGKDACDATKSPSALPLTFDDAKYGRVGVIVAMSESPSTVRCGDAEVTCFRSSTDALGFVHGWSDQPAVTNPTADVATTGSPPQPRSVWLLPGTCGDAYFIVKNTSCSIGVGAKVDFQPREYDVSGNPRTVGNGGSAQPVIAVKAVVTTSSGTSTYPMTWDSTNKAWTVAGVTVPPDSGPVTVKLSWEQSDNGVTALGACKIDKKSDPNPCKGAFPDVLQRAMSGGPMTSGPLQLMQIGDLGNTSGVNDVQRCSSAHPSCTTNFVVRIGIGGVLKLAEPGDPPIVLRVGGGGSQNQSIDCEKNVGMPDELWRGCNGDYRRNTGQACPSPQVFNTAPPWYCVGTEPGASPNQIAAGINHRVLGSEKPTTCTSPNHWPNYQPGDPRIFPLFVVPYGSFQGTGQQTFPIREFAFFYVTGWVGQGGGFDNPCQGQGDDPVVAGAVTGHFIKYIDPLGRSDDEKCDLGSISGCVAVMTR